MVVLERSEEDNGQFLMIGIVFALNLRLLENIFEIFFWSFDFDAYYNVFPPNFDSFLVNFVC